MPCLIACFLAIKRSSAAIKSSTSVKRVGDRDLFVDVGSYRHRLS